jgi:hydrogenase maturation protease
MARVLIIAYGNPMRCDDGLAWRAADELEGKFSGSDVEIVRRHQLAPELAETVSRCETVIFVDAASADAAGNGPPGEVRCAQIAMPEVEVRFSHQLSSGAIVALASQLFFASPRAFSVTLTGECFDHGESLSPAVGAALPALVTRIEALVQQFLSPEYPADSYKT